MLDYTIDVMLFALAVYKCSLKHHFFLKYDLQLQKGYNALTLHTTEEVKELLELEIWLVDCPYIFLKAIITDEEQK